MNRVQKRAEERESKARVTEQIVPLRFQSVDVYTRLAHVAREKGVSVRVYLKALVLESTGIRPLLTEETPELMTRIVKERWKG